MGGFDAPGLDEDFSPSGQFISQLVVNIGKPGENPWRERLLRLYYGEVVSAL